MRKVKGAAFYYNDTDRRGRKEAAMLTNEAGTQQHMHTTQLSSVLLVLSSIVVGAAVIGFHVQQLHSFLGDLTQNLNQTAQVCVQASSATAQDAVNAGKGMVHAPELLQPLHC
jgi:hypothetical protein